MMALNRSPDLKVVSWLNSDLLFDPTSLMTDFDQDIINANILTKFLNTWAKMFLQRYKQDFKSVDLVTFFLIPSNS